MTGYSTPDLKLDAFTIPILAAERAPALLACDRDVSCDRARPGDVTGWCWPCFVGYIRDLKEGNDWMGGFDPATGRVVRGFHDHPESLEVVDLACRDIAPFGPWDVPTADQIAELREMMGETLGDRFLGDDERDILAHSSLDAAWAAEHLDQGPADDDEEDAVLFRMFG